ncbi:hypothetical protein GGG16DRAFT_105496 [Schizophyllum commune]
MPPKRTKRAHRGPSTLCKCNCGKFVTAKTERAHLNGRAAPLHIIASRPERSSIDFLNSDDREVTDSASSVDSASPPASKRTRLAISPGPTHSLPPSPIASAAASSAHIQDASRVTSLSPMGDDDAYAGQLPLPLEPSANDEFAAHASEDNCDDDVDHSNRDDDDHLLARGDAAVAAAADSLARGLAVIGLEDEHTSYAAAADEEDTEQGGNEEDDEEDLEDEEEDEEDEEGREDDVEDDEADEEDEDKDDEDNLSTASSSDDLGYDPNNPEDFDEDLERQFVELGPDILTEDDKQLLRLFAFKNSGTGVTESIRKAQVA